MASYNRNPFLNNNEQFAERMTRLKYANLTGSVVKGIKETLRAIESGKAKIVYCARSENEDYLRLIKTYSELYKKEVVYVDNWLELRDTLFNKVLSSDIIEKANKQGKIPKIKPKCYCAAIIEEN